MVLRTLLLRRNRLLRPLLHPNSRPHCPRIHLPQTLLLGHHHGLSLGIRRLHPPCPRLTQSTKRNLRYSQSTILPPRTTVDQCIRVHDCRPLDILSPSRKENLAHQSY
jgi:hypothetical protein